MDVDCGSARDRLGRSLGGKYRLEQVLGAGGTAVVYRAADTEGNSVAIKVLHDHLSRSEEVCRRFVREGQLGNVLNHSGVVRVLDHGETEEGCPYLVLEFLEGESLEELRVRKGGRVPLDETLELCDQLLAVLEVAHAKNIVHRDIKPSNLFVTSTGELKVLDFGIARLVDDTSATSTKTGQMVGTPAFMPPEQALSRPREVDARTDLWSVGATLFTLLSSEHVHIAESSSEHLVKAATLHARSLARALPGVPANVEALVARCLAFDKAARWTSAASMRAELAFVRDEPGRRIGTSTSPPPERTPSDPNTPTLQTDPRMQAAAGVLTRTDRPDRTSDTNMSVTSLPGFPRSRRRWLLPIAIASTSLLVVTSTIALVLAVRSTTPSAAAEAAPVHEAPALPTNEVPLGPPPPPVVAVPGDPSAKVAVSAAAPRASVPPPIAAKPAPASVTSGKKRSNRDVYKPF